MKIIKKVLIYAFLLFSMYIFSQITNKILGTACPLIYIFDIPCPLCGMTRAHIALLKGDIELAFAYNPLFFLGIPFILSL